MNSKERRRYWLQFTRQQRVIELQFTPKVQKVIDKQISSFITEAEKVGWQQAYKNMPVIQDELMAVLKSLYKKTASVYAPTVRTVIRQKGLGFNQTVIDTIVRWLVEYGLNLVTKIDQTTKEGILRILFQGEQEGLGFRDIAKMVKESWINSYSRSLRIVRTESMRAANKTMMDGAEEQAFVVDKIWVSAHDERVRQFTHQEGKTVKHDNYDHALLDGVQIPLEQKFRQTGRDGVVAEAMQPVDPDAPASFTINCRCVLAFENKRDSNGRLIRKQ